MKNLKYSDGSATYFESLEKKIAELEKQIVAIEKNTDYWADKSAKTLTDEEIQELALSDEFWISEDCTIFDWHKFARAILRKAQEK